MITRKNSLRETEVKNKRLQKIHVGNKGISLVELIVVLAIMSVLIGLTGVGIGMVSNKPATQVSNNINIGLNRCRVQTMGKNAGFIAFFEGSDGIYMVERYGELSDLSYTVSESDPDAKRIGKKGVAVSYSTTYSVNADSTVDFDSAESSAVSIGTNTVYFKFKRSDGSCDTDTMSTLNHNPVGNNNVPAVIVKKGNKKYMITVQKLTGKVLLTQG